MLSPHPDTVYSGTIKYAPVMAVVCHHSTTKAAKIPVSQVINSFKSV